MPAGVAEEVNGLLGDGLSHAFEPGIGKTEQSSRLSGLKHDLVGKLGERFEEDDIEEAFEAAVSVEFRKRVLDTGQRPDGRGLKEIRPLDCDVGLLPRTHGSGLFQRGRDADTWHRNPRLGRRRPEDRHPQPRRVETGSCCTTTSRRSAPERQSAWAPRAAATSATEPWRKRR